MVGVWMLGMLLGAGTAHAQNEEPTGREVRNIAKAFHCDRHTVSMEYLGTEQYGRWVIRGWAVTGCGEPFMSATGRHRGLAHVFMDDLGVRRRAHLDLTCSAEAVSYRYVDHTTRVASGCGRQMTYIIQDSGRWVANVAVEHPRIGGIEGGSLPD